MPNFCFTLPCVQLQRRMTQDADCQSYKAHTDGRREATSFGPEQCLLANVWGQGHETVPALAVLGMDMSLERT